MSAFGEDAEFSAARQRAEALRAQIEYHAYRYYVLDAPEVSDAQFDDLVHELESLEQRFPALITPDSPTRRLGAPPSTQFAPVRHSQPLLSLDNVFDDTELDAWYARTVRALGAPPALVVEPKLDGVAVALVFEHGRFTRAATRGDGEVGEDVTANVRTIRGLPARLRSESPPPWLEVRGEVYLRIPDFERINEELGSTGRPLFANPRNAAAGSLRQKDPSVTASRPLALSFHGLIRADGEHFESHAQALAWFREVGLRVDPDAVRVETLDEAKQVVSRIRDRRDALDHEIDGAVVKVDALAAQNELGATSRAPRWAVAYKFAAREATTRLESIFVSIGRSGLATPFAQLVPVRVGGATISMATLHNADDVARKDIRIGDTVVVRRAGEVIPEVVAPIPSVRTGAERAFEMPRDCPSCGTALVRVEGEAATRCPNYHCPVQVVGRIAHFASRDAMDIRHLGDRTAHDLVEARLVRDPGDLFLLTPADLTKLPGLKQRSIANLLASIDAARDRSLARLLIALAIPHVGPTAAARLANAMRSIEGLANASVDEIAEIEGVGEVIARAVRQHFDRPETRELLDKLERGRVRTKAPPAVREGPLAGLSIALTGTLATMSRDEAKARIEALAGTLAPAVTKRTDYLVVGASPGTKLGRAQHLGVKLLDDATFTRWLSRGTREP